MAVKSAAIKRSLFLYKSVSSAAGNVGARRPNTVTCCHSSLCNNLASTKPPTKPVAPNSKARRLIVFPLDWLGLLQANLHHHCVASGSAWSPNLPCALAWPDSHPCPQLSSALLFLPWYLR